MKNIKLNKNKEWYANQLEETMTENTFKAYVNRLKDLQIFEDSIEKEIQDFNKKDIEGFFLSLGKSVNSLNTTRSVLVQYYNFLLKHKIARGVNKIEFVTQSLLKKWSDLRRGKYQFVSEVEAEQIARRLIFNNRDKAIFMLCWCGLSIEEIINLKYKDIDFDNGTAKIRYKENGVMKEKIYKLTDFTLEKCRMSYHSKEYYINNGLMTKSSNDVKKYMFEDTDKVIKPTNVGQKSDSNSCSRSAAENTFRLLRQIPRTEINAKVGTPYFYPLEFLTSVSLRKSGLFHNIVLKSRITGESAKGLLSNHYTNVALVYDEYLLYKKKVFNRNMFLLQDIESAIDQE